MSERDDEVEGAAPDGEAWIQERFSWGVAPGTGDWTPSTNGAPPPSSPPRPAPFDPFEIADATPMHRQFEDPPPQVVASAATTENGVPAAPIWPGLEQAFPVAAPREETEPGGGTQWRSLLIEMAETLILTLLIFVVMRAVVQNYRIEGFSMEPNLHEGQRLFVDKLSYYFSEPQRGDVVVFEFPQGDPNGPEKDYIKRIIGLPGDLVECRPGEILVNGERIDEIYGPNPHSYNCAPTLLSNDEYFVLGDNRNHSSDSSNWGPLERKYIIGRAWLLYWPFSQFGLVPRPTIPAAPPATVPTVQSP